MTNEINPRVTDDDKGEITVSLDDRELRGWSYKDDSERRAKMLCAREYVEGWHDARQNTAGLIKEFEAIGPFDAETLQDLRRMVPFGIYDAGGTVTQNPLTQVYFRAGLLACREYMARFVEQGGDQTTATSIRANWWPSLGDDPGPPRLFHFAELCEESDGLDGKPVFKTLPISPSVEALAPAYQFFDACSLPTGKCGRAGVSDPSYQDYCNANYGPEDIPAPEVWVDCPECGGEGGWEQHCRTYELGCGFAHDDSEWRTCHVCSGTGGMICEAVGKPVTLEEIENDDAW